jgi:tripartite-type tricarboxylate transporter receptor subunit TctC
LAASLSDPANYDCRYLSIGRQHWHRRTIIADKFSETLGQQVIVDQRAGAGGTVAAKQIARGTPDGYTIMLGFTGTLGIAPSLYPNAGYDPRKDLAPVGRIGVAPSSLVVHPSFPVRSVAELIAYAKQNPGKVNFGSAGIGTVAHVAGELLVSMAGIKLVHVPYRGTGPNLTDLLGGHIPMSFPYRLRMKIRRTGFCECWG